MYIHIFAMYCIDIYSLYIYIYIYIYTMVAIYCLCFCCCEYFYVCISCHCNLMMVQWCRLGLHVFRNMQWKFMYCGFLSYRFIYIYIYTYIHIYIHIYIYTHINGWYVILLCVLCVSNVVARVSALYLLRSTGYAVNSEMIGRWQLLWSVDSS